MSVLKGKLKRPLMKVNYVKPGPVWKGPEVDGITFSLLSRFLVCRERFRCLVVEGLKPAEGFNAKIEFGNMWHACEEAHARGAVWYDELSRCASDLSNKYMMDREKIAHWTQVTEAMFPRYVDYWLKHPDVVSRTPLLEEESFSVDYDLPSGRTVKLRGKWDSVDLVGVPKKVTIWNQENKTKSSIDQTKLNRQLTFDLQTMIYVVAMTEYDFAALLEPKGINSMPAIGVRYNVVRRPAHRSVGSLLKKMDEDFADGRDGEWFARWNVPVMPSDIKRFQKECLDPILENLYDWWYDQTKDDNAVPKVGDYRTPSNWRHPFGVYNVLDEGGSSDLDEYLASKSEIGLERVTNLFPELT